MSKVPVYQTVTRGRNAFFCAAGVLFLGSIPWQRQPWQGCLDVRCVHAGRHSCRCFKISFALKLVLISFCLSCLHALGNAHDMRQLLGVVHSGCDPMKNSLQRSPTDCMHWYMVRCPCSLGLQNCSCAPIPVPLGAFTDRHQLSLALEM